MNAKKSLFAVALTLTASVLCAEQIQYVATNGKDTNDGLTVDTPKATIVAAVAALGEPGGTVYVAKGEYQFEPMKAEEPLVTITTPVEVIGMTGKADDVVIKRGTTNAKGFRLENAGAKLRYLTIKGMFLARANSSAGAGVYMVDGVVEDCIICDANGGHWDSRGAGIYMENGRVSRCILRDNTLLHGDVGKSWKPNLTSYGAAICATGGLIEDCLITGNNCGFAGAVYLTTWDDKAKAQNGRSLVMLNCTITGNTSYTAGDENYMDYSGVRVEAHGGPLVVNCAIFGNKASARAEAAHNHVWTEPNSAYVNCAAEVDFGQWSKNCVKGVPAFLQAGDYHITPNSCCLNAGADRAAYNPVSETDLDGKPRLSAAVVDIGCYECQVNDLTVGFAKVPSCGFTKQDLEFALNVIGATGGVTCEWDMDGDGTVDKTTVNELSCTWSYETVGNKLPKVTVTDGTGASKTVAADAAFYIAPQFVFADAANAEGQAFPYDTPETAAADVQTAIDVAGSGSTVSVADGEYVKSVLEEPCFVVEKDITLVSLSGDPKKCILKNGTKSTWNENRARRVLLVNNAKAFVAGFTLTGGHCQSQSGAGLYIDAKGGTVSNCVIRGCQTENWNGDGAGAYVSGMGLLTDSVIRDCKFASSTFFSQETIAVLAVYGKVENCLICDCNGDTAYMQNIVGVHNNGSLVNCTVANCMCRPDFEGLYPGEPQPRAFPRRVGVWADAKAVVKNCAILGVLRETESETGVFAPAPWRGTAASFVNCAVDGEKPNDSCILADTTVFKGYSKGDYRLKGGCALVNAGVPVTLHSTIDLAKMPRVQDKAIDIGCYEANASGFLLFVR